MLDYPKTIPLTVITGFLGAGKTTLLNRILNGDHGLRVAVLVNDFGSINIDAELVVGVESDVTSLANGCVCCSIRDDLIAAVEQVIRRPERPEYIVLEASGVADPAGIAVTVTDAGLRDRVRLDSITCVLDADQVFAYRDFPALLQLKLRQIGCADLLILNKADLAGPPQVKKVREWIDEHFSRIRIIETNYCEAPYEVLLAVGRFDASERAINQSGRTHRHDEEPSSHRESFSTWCYETDRPMSVAVLKEMARKLPGTIFRCKGIVYTADAPERRTVLQVVGRRADVSLQDEWNGRKPFTRIVVIGAAGSIDAEALRQSFNQCLSTVYSNGIELNYGVDQAAERGETGPEGKLARKRPNLP